MEFRFALQSKLFYFCRAKNMLVMPLQPVFCNDILNRQMFRFYALLSQVKKHINGLPVKVY